MTDDPIESAFNDAFRKTLEYETDPVFAASVYLRNARRCIVRACSYLDSVTELWHRGETAHLKLDDFLDDMREEQVKLKCGCITYDAYFEALLKLRELASKEMKNV